jgi:hypothetical protein
LIVSLTFDKNEPVALSTFIDVFHGWLQATEGIYHDVADYSHMRGGPGIVLVAHEANVSMDETGNRRGLLYKHKRPLMGSNQEKLRHVFRSALDHCRRVEEEPALKGRMSFRADEADIMVNDRLLAPNTEEAFLSIKDDLERFFHRLYGPRAISVERDPDPRKRLNVRITASGPFDIASLRRNLEQAWEEEASHA